MKRSVVFLIALLMFSVIFCHKNFAEAKADIHWIATDVTLDSGKCTVHGYFENRGDTGGTVTNIKFVVDVTTSDKKTNIYSKVFNVQPKNCYISAGAQISWNFWIDDYACPRYTRDDMHWDVTSRVTF